MEINLETLEIEIVDIEPIDGAVQVFARAWSDGVQIGFGKDGTVDIERFRFINPPVLVPDNTGAYIVEIQADPTLGLEASVVRYREDPEQALLSVLTRNVIDLKNAHVGGNIEPGKIGNTTTTVYAGSNDGYTYDVETTWSGVRAAAGQGSSFNATILAVQASRESASEYVIYRSPMPFDTSSIADGDTIDSAVLYFTPQTNNSNGSDNQSLALDTVTTITPATGNYAISNWGGTDQATREFLTSFTVDAEDSLTLNSTGLGNINKTGTTNFGLRLSFDMDNTTPSSLSNTMRVFPYASEQTGTTKDPRLVIEHSAGGATFIPRVSFIM